MTEIAGEKLVEEYAKYRSQASRDYAEEACAMWKRFQELPIVPITMSNGDSVFDGGDQPPEDPSRQVVEVDLTELFNWLMGNQSESRQVTAERLLKAFKIHSR